MTKQAYDAFSFMSNPLNLCPHWGHRLYNTPLIHPLLILVCISNFSIADGVRPLEILTCTCLIAGCLSGEVTWQRNAEWRHSVRWPCDTMRIRRRAYRNKIMLIRSSVLYGTMYRVASICFCIFQRCTSHRTMYMTYYTTYTWIRHDSVKAEYDFYHHLVVFSFHNDTVKHFP